MQISSVKFQLGGSI